MTVSLAESVPVESDADVLAALPAFLNPEDPAEVRDGLVAALTAIFETYQDRASEAAAQADVLRATGQYLDEKGNDRGVQRAEGELDEPYRRRILLPADVVTPTAIVAAAKAILAPYTSKGVQYSESVLDRFFVRSAATAAGGFRAFVAAAGTGMAPYYPKRLHPAFIVTNGGYERPNSNPQTGAIFRRAGRFFVLRVPDITPAGFYANAFSSPATRRVGFFVGDGDPDNTSFVRTNQQAALAVYQAIVNVVSRIKGHGVRWMLVADTRLT